MVKYAYPYVDYNLEKHEFIQTMIRDFTDMYNFFAVNNATRAFTSVGETVRQY